MKDVPLSNLETAFVLSALGEGRRMDGRAPYDVRHVDISFGSDFGCAQTRLGDTRVMAQVSCKMNVPKDARPAEGLMRINVGEHGRCTDVVEGDLISGIWIGNRQM